MKLLNFCVNSATVDYAAMERALVPANDWLRHGFNSWLIYTDETAQVWSNRFDAALPTLRMAGYIVIEVDPTQYAGWMPSAIWEWVNRHRPISPLGLLGSFLAPNAPSLLAVPSVPFTIAPPAPPPKK
ncbi:MAG: hypothetical protein ACRD1L_01080 [Terriglobales bacterium]